ncbi:MAG: hypothetical protein ACF8LK_06220 [Phycisphaerales bacterium JB041]
MRYLLSGLPFREVLSNQSIGVLAGANAPDPAGWSGATSALRWILVLAGLYGLVGVGVAAWFVGWGAARRDAAAARAPLRVRVLFAPGAVAVWPILLTSRGHAGGVTRPEGH